MRHITHTFPRRLSALLLCLALLTGLLPMSAWAAEGDAGLPEQSTAQTSTEGGGVSDEDTTPGETRGENPGADDRGTDESPAGNGSKDNPYQISTAGDLLWFANLVNGTLKGKKADADAWAVLIKDIDLGGSAGNPWTPIGSNSENAYTGTFDGKGHTISGLYINSSSDNQGFVGYLGQSGVIQNLAVAGAVTSTGSDSNVGGVCGYNDQGIIQNCRYSGTVAGKIAGGICGYNSNKGESSSDAGVAPGTVENCLNIGEVTATGSQNPNIGGVCGYNNNVATVTNCYYQASDNLLGIGGGNSTGEATSKTETELASGAVAYLLNGKDAGKDTSVWRQNLDNDAAKDTYPVPDTTHGVVYQIGNGESARYSNYETGSKPTPTPTPPPYIPPTPTGPTTGASDGWEDIREEIGGAEKGDTITIDMNGETEVPAEIFEEVAGKDVTVEIDMGDVTWTVNGQDVPTNTTFTDLDLGVDMDTSGISVDVINTVTGELGSVQITLAHDGQFGFALTLTAPLGKENKGLWANLYHYDEAGETLIFETSAKIDEDGNTALRMTHASQYAIVIDDKSHDLPFTDLGENQWYEPAVAYAYRHDIMEGTSDTTFVPNKSLTRAEAVQVLYNLEGKPTVSGNATFPDLTEDWYKPAIAWAESTGVVDGYEDGTFHPDEPVNRMEFAQMLYNYAAYKGCDLTAKGDLTAFPDGNQVQEWAEPAMAWANGNELINGHDDGTLDPAGTTTRAQAAAILMRFDQNLAE